MRWFIILLLIANIALFFWVQREHRDATGPTEMPPPEIGRLRILNQDEVSTWTETGVDASPSDVPAGQTESVPVTDDPEPVADEPQPEPEQVSRVSERSTDPGSESPVDLAPELRVATDTSLPEEPEPEPVTEPEPAAPQAVAPAPPPRTCARVGAFVPAQADALLQQLPPHIELLSDTSEEVAVPDGYFVMHPALEDRAAGRRKVRELRDAGFEDLWLFPSGRFRNAISLGMFGRAASAQRRAASVRKKGFDVEVIPKSSRKERRWLDLTRAGEDELQGAIPLPKGVTLTTIPCP